MRGGQNIKSTKEKELAGTSRSDRDADRLENFTPTFSEVPSAPKGFDLRHRKKWAEIAQKLVDLAILCEQDLAALAMLIQNLLIAEDAHKSVVEHGIVIKTVTAKGEKFVRNPAFQVYLDAQKVAKPLLEQFGMTPKARQSLKTKEPEQADPLADLLKGDKGGGRDD